MIKPIYICGSTASGKSSFAIHLAQHLDGEIVNGDAYQLYSGLEVITAAPSPLEKTLAPHHLFSFLPVSTQMDAQKYRDITLPCITDVINRGKVPIIVGGSGMYLKFLTHGPSPVPSSDPVLRSELEKRSDEELVQEFTALDPEGAQFTNLQNRRYVIRALEICLLSGGKMSVLKTDWKLASDKVERSLQGAVLQWDAETLRKRILSRTKEILRSGAIEEVESLIGESPTCEKAIGISQIRQYLKGEITLERCEELIFFATAQYAKRQRTWFKKEAWLTPLSAESFTSQQLVEEFSSHLSDTRSQR